MIEWITGLIKKHIDVDFYGSITINFSAGKITTCKIEKTEKPPSGLT